MGGHRFHNEEVKMVFFLMNESKYKRFMIQNTYN